MSDHITLNGIIGTEPRHFTTSAGVEIVSFRLATSQSHFDPNANEWKDPGSNWFTVSAFRQLANNCSVSLHKGERVVVVGRLKLRQWEKEEKTGLAVEVEAVSIGHDLSYGTAEFTRVSMGGTSAAPDEDTEADPAEGSGWADAA